MISLARHLLEFQFKGIFGIEEKSFARFPFGQKLSGIVILYERTSEELKSGTGELSMPKNSKESLVPSRLDTTSKLIMLGSVR